MPKADAEERGFALGQEISTTFDEKGAFIVRKTVVSAPDKDITDAVSRATTYIEKYRGDFEALANK